MVNSIKDRTVNSIVEILIKKSYSLGVFPPVLREFFEKSSDKSLPELARILRADPELATQCVKTANAVYYSYERVKTIESALIRIGLRQAKSIILSARTFLIGKSLSDEDYKKFENLWKRSIKAATVAKVIAHEVLDWHDINKAEVYFAGLLSHCMEIIWGRIIGKWMVIPKLASEELKNVAFDNKKINLFECGEIYFDKLKMPDEIIEIYNKLKKDPAPINIDEANKIIRSRVPVSDVAYVGILMAEIIFGEQEDQKENLWEVTGLLSKQKKIKKESEEIYNDTLKEYGIA